MLAGISLLLADVLWFIFSELPRDMIEIISTFSYMLGNYGIWNFLECLFWILVFFCWIFAAVALFSRNPKVTSVAFILSGTIYLLRVITILIMMAFYGNEYLMLFTPLALILTGVAVKTRSGAANTTAIITAVVGFVTSIIYGFLIIGTYSNPSSPYFGDPSIVWTRVIEMIANVFLLAAMILTCVAVKKRTPAVGDPAAGYAGQPQSPYAQSYAGQAQSPYAQSPYAGQPQSPYAQPYAGQPQSPYAQPYAGRAQQPYAQQQYSQPYADLPQQQYAQSPYAGQPQESDPDETVWE